MAGAYVGLGIILIFTLGGAVPPDYRALIMGASFGIALTLVILAGSELFTRHTMYMTIGRLRSRITTADLAKSWAFTWIGNLVGAFALAYLYVLGGGSLTGETGAILLKVADYKMNSPADELVARAILCNWLVCLAIWMSARVDSDSAKTIVIFWCLFAFIASGYEHSVANMTLLSISLLIDHPETISWAGMAHNLLWVTIGNTIAGVVFMALGYSAASPVTQSKEAVDQEHLLRRK